MLHPIDGTGILWRLEHLEKQALWLSDDFVVCGLEVLEKLGDILGLNKDIHHEGKMRTGRHSFKRGRPREVL